MQRVTHTMGFIRNLTISSSQRGFPVLRVRRGRKDTGKTCERAPGKPLKNDRGNRQTAHWTNLTTGGCGEEETAVRWGPDRT